MWLRTFIGIGDPHSATRCNLQQDIGIPDSKPYRFVSLLLIRSPLLRVGDGEGIDGLPAHKDG